MRTLPISSPRFALPTGLLSSEQRRRSVMGALALCLFAAAYLVVGHRLPGSYVAAEPVSSAEAYRLEIGSILSSDELSPHTQQTLGLLPEATNAVRQSESVLIDGEKPPLAAVARQMRCDLSEFFDVVDPQLHASDEIRRVFTEGFILKPWSQYPPMQAFAELPISPRIPFYSIIGSIGDGRLDGYVSVQCAHECNFTRCI